jgi:hypothetical protein
MSTISERKTEIVVDADDGNFALHILGGQGQERHDGSRPHAVVIHVALKMIRPEADTTPGEMVLFPYDNSLRTLRQLRDLIIDALAEAERVGLV